MISKAQQRRYEEIYRPAYDALMKFYPLTLDDLPGEIWKPIAGYEDYHVSNFGRVKSFKNEKIIIRKPKPHKNGYLSIKLCKDGKEKWLIIHRLVALAFISNPLNKPEVNHIDTHKLNNYVGNLEWTTSSENMQHAYDMGLAPKGEDRSNAKLTNKQVLYIRENPDGLTTYELAEKFGLTQSVISEVQTGKKYKTVGGKIRKAKLKKYSPPVPENIKQKIRAEYVYGSHEFGARALAKKYGVVHRTILNIVHSAE